MNEIEKSMPKKFRWRWAYEAFVPALVVWMAIMIMPSLRDRDSAWGLFKVVLSGVCVWTAFLYIITLLRGGSSR